MRSKASRIIRLSVLIGLVLAIFLGYGVRLMQLQIVEGEMYLSFAERSTTKRVEVKAPRGEIVDCYGRPMVVNAGGYNLILDRAYLKSGTENVLIIKLCKILEGTGEEWVDLLPISEEYPYRFAENQENSIERMKKLLGLQTYATEENAMEEMLERYEISYPLDSKKARLLAGIRYSMELSGFSMTTTYTFAEDISKSTVTRIKEMGDDLLGAEIEEVSIRQYLSGDIMPHLIGQVGLLWPEEYAALKEQGKNYKLNDVIGKFGIELAMEDQLRGTSGTREIVLDKDYNVISVNDVLSPKPGNTVVLTVDSVFQKKVQNILKDGIIKLQQTAAPGKGKETDAGTVVVLNAKTGALIASADYPSYDLSTYRQDYAELAQNPLNPLFDRAIKGSYMPGSCFKPATAVAALATGNATASTRVDCTGRYYYYAPDYTPGCSYSYGCGALSVTTALKRSCNVFFYEVGRLTGIEPIIKYANLLGLGTDTGFEISGPLGRVSSPAFTESMGGTWYPGNVLQAAIGQLDNTFTPLQMAVAYGAIANDGVRMKAHMVKSVKTYDLQSNVIPPEDMIQVVETIDDLTAKQYDLIQEGLYKATTEMGGTSRSYFIGCPIKVAAKTGTPQATGGYDNAVFCSYAPYDDPELVVVVILEKGYQGYVGAAIARNVIEAYYLDDSTKGDSVQQNGILLQ